jgi:ketosteroid isomerase-like protein
MDRGLQPIAEEERVLAAEREFFTALTEADTSTLTRILAEDFTLTDLTGGQMTRDQFLGVLAEGQMQFLSIIPQGGTRVRLYGEAVAAAVTGRTVMQVRFMDQELSVESRYTHIYAVERGAWRLEIAQGTPIQQSEG